MKKRIMMIMLTIMMLSSCYYADQVFGDIKDEYVNSQGRKKNGAGAYKEDRYKSGVYGAINDIVKRPIDKKVQFEGIALIIPENTEINSKTWNLVDTKTGYGIPISFYDQNGCIQKKIGDKIYSITYNDYISGVKQIGEKLMKINSFKNTCN